jgi:hypothetical protein
MTRPSSIASSEFHSRLTALQLQLEEEHKRRLEVEKAIQQLSRESVATPKGGCGDGASVGRASAVSSNRIKPIVPQLLSEDALANIDVVSTSSSKRAGGGVAAWVTNQLRTATPPVAVRTPTATSSTAGSNRPPIPRPPPIDKKVTVEGPQLPLDQYHVIPTGAGTILMPKKLKPPLPPLAKPISAGKSVGSGQGSKHHRRKLNPCDLYEAQIRHERREQLLVNFEKMTGGGTNYGF